MENQDKQNKKLLKDSWGVIKSVLDEAIVGGLLKGEGGLLKLVAISNAVQMLELTIENTTKGAD